MLIEKDIQKLLHQLASGDAFQVALDGSNIMIRFVDGSSKVSLSALVYEGDNYIPFSVRHSLSRRSPFSHPYLLTYFTIDEDRYQVTLNYLGYTELTQNHLKELLEDFGLMAEKWRLYLDEHDRNDLVHVRVK